MFERFTQKALRAIFFARYEASRFGSAYVETEHLLLGLLREDQELLTMFLGNIEGFRSEIENHVTQGQAVSTSVEIPLSKESKKVLNLASDEARKLAHRHVETAHLLLGLLGVEGSLAARLLIARGVEAEDVREKISKYSRPSVRATAATGSWGEPRNLLQGLLDGLKNLNAEQLLDLFAASPRFIDAAGRSWAGEEISKNCETLFAHYAKKNAAAVVENTSDADNLFLANMLWSYAMLASEQRAWLH